MISTAPTRIPSGRLLAVLVLALGIGSAHAVPAGHERILAAVTAGHVTAQSGGDPLRCTVTLLSGHRARCDFLTGGTAFP
jgi:hypothetical protein